MSLPDRVRASLPAETRLELKQHWPLGVGRPFDDSEIDRLVEGFLERFPVASPGQVSDGVLRIARDQATAEAKDQAAKSDAERRRKTAEERLAARAITRPAAPDGEPFIMADVWLLAYKAWNRLQDSGAAEAAAEEALAKAKKALTDTSTAKANVSDLTDAEQELRLASLRLEAEIESLLSVVAHANDPATVAKARELETLMAAASGEAFSEALAPHLEQARQGMAQIQRAIAGARAVGSDAVRTAVEARSVARALGIETSIRAEDFGVFAVERRLRSVLAFDHDSAHLVTPLPDLERFTKQY